MDYINFYNPRIRLKNLKHQKTYYISRIAIINYIFVNFIIKLKLFYFYIHIWLHLCYQNGSHDSHHKKQKPYRSNLLENSNYVKPL